MNRVSKEQVAVIRDRDLTEIHASELLTVALHDRRVLLAHIENQDAVIKGLHEDLRDAGRELREAEHERATLAQSVEDRGWGW